MISIKKGLNKIQFISNLNFDFLLGVTYIYIYQNF